MWGLFGWALKPMSKRGPNDRGRPRSKPQAKKSPAKKSPAKRSPAKPAAAKRSAAKKSTAKRTPAKRTTAAAAAATAAIREPEPLRAEGLQPTAGFADTQWTFREQLKRINLRQRSTQIALASILVILALIGALLAWPRSSDDSADLAGQAAADSESVAEKVTKENGRTAEEEAKQAGGRVAETADEATGPEAVDNPYADLDFAAKLNALIKPISTAFPNGNPNTWSGVTRDKIKAVFSYPQQLCGPDTLAAINAAAAQVGSSTRYYRDAPKDQAEGNRESVESINALVKVFNDRGLEAADAIPAIKTLNRKFGATKERPFYGRRLVHEFIDGGNYQCPEKTTEAAIDIAQQRKPFVVFNNFDGAQYNMADALNAKAPAKSRPMHFGTLWLSDKDYTRWSPYAWTQFNSGTRGVDLYSSYVCSKLWGKPAVNSPDYKTTKRKFALLYPNLPGPKQVATELRSFVKSRCGSDIYAGRVFEYDPDLSRAADEGSTIAVRLKVEGVTSLTYLLDPVFPLFQIIEMAAQDYHPEFIWTPSGYYDSSTVQRLYEQPMVDKASFGVTQFGIPGGFGFSAGDSFYVWHDQHKKSPKTGKACDPRSEAGMDHDEEYCKAPQAIVTWYYTTLAMLSGVIFAGPDLKPLNVTKGLWNVPTIRYGIAGPTEHPFAALIGGARGKHYFIKDGLEFRWRASFISPPPESKLGWVEYPDCQRHYLRWPNSLSTGWEKGGKNYSAYCGDAKWAPSPYTPSGEAEDTCADTPSGKCERDRYPRWREWEQG